MRRKDESKWLPYGNNKSAPIINDKRDKTWD